MPEAGPLKAVLETLVVVKLRKLEISLKSLDDNIISLLPQLYREYFELILYEPSLNNSYAQVTGDNSSNIDETVVPTLSTTPNC